ncbi:MAG: hypothetical protein ACM31C_21170 [Acidobacteriota bacterium]
MRAVVSKIGSLLLAAVATCAVATCRRDMPPPRHAPLREAPPIGAKPEHPQPILGARPAAFMLPPGDDADVEPAAVAPSKPPLDAGVDGPLNLPPIPDAGPIVRDAGTPMK